MAMLTPSLLPAEGTPVVIDVRFKLTDLDNHPIAPENVRLVLGTGAGWQKPDAGQRFTTDDHGEHQLTVETVLETRRRKMPTNFFSSLVSRPEPTDFLQVAAELEYAGHRWLYVVDLYRFRRDGTVMDDRFALYSRSAQGDFTNQARYENGGWRIADLNGLALSRAGYDLSNFGLQPDLTDPSHRRWVLDLAFKKAPAPVMR